MDETPHNSLPEVLEIKTTRLRWLMILLSFVSWLAFIAFAMNSNWVSIFWLILGLVGIWLSIYYSARVVLSQEGISADFIFGTYKINWADVDLIIYAWGNLFFEGKERKLSVPAWEYWRGLSQNEAKNTVEKLSGQEIGVSYQLKRHFPSWKQTRAP